MKNDEASRRINTSYGLRRTSQMIRPWEPTPNAYYIYIYVPQLKAILLIGWLNSFECCDETRWWWRRRWSGLTVRQRPNVTDSSRLFCLDWRCHTLLFFVKLWLRCVSGNAAANGGRDVRVDFILDRRPLWRASHTRQNSREDRLITD